MRSRALITAVLSGVFAVSAACDRGRGGLSDTGEVPECVEGYLADRGSCVPETCGTGTWGALEVDASTVFVDAGADEGGDGTEERPLTSIQAALDLAGSRGGGMVAVAAGTYPETLEMTTDHAGVHLAGRCRELVILDASVGDDSTPGIEIAVGAGMAGVSGLSVVGSKYEGIRVGSGEVILVGVRIEGCEYIGLVGYRGSDVHPSSLTARGCEVVGNRLSGVFAEESGTLVELTDTVVRDSLADSNGDFGYGIFVQRSAELRATECDLDHNTGAGLHALDYGSKVELSNCEVSATVPMRHALGGYGVEIMGGAKLVADDCLLFDNRGVGVLAVDPGTQVELRGTTIRDTGPDDNGRLGYGIETYGGAQLTAHDCLVANNTTGGIQAALAGTWVAVQDCCVNGTQPDTTGEFGYGIEVQSGATLTASNCELDRNTSIGFFVTDIVSRAQLRDVTISRTMAGLDDESAVALGLCIQNGAHAAAHGTVLYENEGPGLHSVGETSLLACLDCDISDNQFAGAVVVDGGALELSSSGIYRTQRSANIGGGVGVYAAQQWNWAAPLLTVSDCTISVNQLAGIHVAGEGAYYVANTAVSESEATPHGPTRL